MDGVARCQPEAERCHQLQLCGRFQRAEFRIVRVRKQVGRRRTCCHELIVEDDAAGNSHLVDWHSGKTGHEVIDSVFPQPELARLLLLSMLLLLLQPASVPPCVS